MIMVELLIFRMQNCKVHKLEGKNIVCGHRASKKNLYYLTSRNMGLIEMNSILYNPETFFR